MKAIAYLFFAFLFFISQEAFCQKAKSKIKQPQDVVRFQDYSYPYYAIKITGLSPFSGVLTTNKTIPILLPRRTSFFTATNERRKITNVMIFTDPYNMKNNTKVLSLNMTEQKILPVCFDFGCTDIVLLPVSIPKDFALNYVSLEPKEMIEDKEMAIVGYIKDSLSIIKTKFSGFLPRDSTYFLTEKSGTKDQSGSPVLLYSKTKGVGKIVLAGVYSGKEISQEYFDQGLISRAYFITRFLNSKTKAGLLGKD